jgi:hypothetical protein
MSQHFQFQRSYHVRPSTSETSPLVFIKHFRYFSSFYFRLRGTLCGRQPQFLTMLQSPCVNSEKIQLLSRNVVMNINSCYLQSFNRYQRQQHESESLRS